MKFKKTAIIAINLNGGIDSLIKSLNDFDFLTYDELQLTYIFPVLSYAVGITVLPLTYALEENREMIEKSIIDRLAKIAESAFKSFEGKVVLKCLFDENPKKMFCDHVNNSNPDLVVVTTREKKGFFESSFTQYVIKHTRSNILILKEK